MINTEIKIEPDFEYDKIVSNVESSRSPLYTTQNSDSELLIQDVIKEETDSKREEMEVPPNFPQSMELAEDKKVRCYLFCSLCHYKTKSHDIFVQHQLIHNILDVQKHHCKICPFETKSEELLKQHNRTHWILDDVVYPCRFCNFKTKHKHGMKVHMKIHQDDPSLVGGYFYFFGLNNTTSEEFYECIDCSCRSGDKKLLKSHVEKHKEINIDEGKKIRCRNCIAKKKAEMFKCPHCSLKTKEVQDRDESKIYVKEEIDEPVTLFHCKYCSFVTATGKTHRNHTLVTHIDSVHSKEQKIHKIRSTKQKKLWKEVPV